MIYGLWFLMNMSIKYGNVLHTNPVWLIPNCSIDPRMFNQDQQDQNSFLSPSATWK